MEKRSLCAQLKAEGLKVNFHKIPLLNITKHHNDYSNQIQIFQLAQYGFEISKFQFILTKAV